MRCLLYVELCLLGLGYLWSPHGIQAITRSRCELQDAVERTQRLQNDIICLEREINQWESASFYKEQFAREQLQMARHNDIVYYLMNDSSKSI